MEDSLQGCVGVVLGGCVGTRPGEHCGLEGSTTCQWSAMVSQFAAMSPFGSMQSSAVLLLQVPKGGKGRKNSLTYLLGNSICLCSTAVTVVFWECKIGRVSLTTLSLGVVAKQAVGQSDRKGQAIVGHIHFQLRNFHNPIYAWLIDAHAKLLVRQRHELVVYCHLINKGKQKRGINLDWFFKPIDCSFVLQRECKGK